MPAQPRISTKANRHKKPPNKPRALLTFLTVLATLCALFSAQALAEGPPILFDVNDSGSSSPDYLTAVGNTLYFAAIGQDENGNDIGCELFMATVDGGVKPLKNIEPEQEDPPLVVSSNPVKLTGVDGLLFFEVDYDVWVSEGTEATTVPLSDKVTGDVGTAPMYLSACNGALYYNGVDTTNRRELWYCSVTNGTYTVQELTNPDANAPALQPDNLTDVNGILFFSANDGDDGRELWQCDGTSLDDYDIHTSGSSSPEDLTAVDGKLYFVADNVNDDNRLYRFDPTATTPLPELVTGSYTNPSCLSNVNGTLYFNMDGSELWQVDGTTASKVGTDTSINPLAMTYVPNAENNVLFSADTTTDGRELWCETSSGLDMVKDVYALGSGVSDNAEFHLSREGLLLFPAGAGADKELWISDGDPNDTSGTYCLTGGSGPINPAKFTNVNQTTFFVASDATYGTELYCLGPPSLEVRDASGALVGLFRANGDIVLKGDLVENAIAQLSPTSNPEFIVCDSTNAPVARLDSSTGNLYVKDNDVDENLASITLSDSTPEFVLKGPSGRVVCVIDNAGQVKLTGTVIEDGLD